MLTRIAESAVAPCARAAAASASTALTAGGPALDHVRCEGLGNAPCSILCDAQKAQGRPSQVEREAQGRPSQVEQLAP